MAAAFEIKCSNDGKFYWHFKAANGEIVASSQMYESKQACIKGIDSIKRDAADAAIKDETE